jgi:2-polyprenyl-3-methyl-5-hydroxy-6-metoxy-1,4-benzoquinol methylase
MILLKTEHELWDTKSEYIEYDDSYPGNKGSLKDKMPDWGNGKSNRKFNEKLFALVPTRPLRILELGCGGGAFIQTCIEDGYTLSFGVDGNPYYRELKQHSWGKFPENFFVADAGKDFTILENGSPMKFDVITSWEFFEHIHPSAVEQLAKNIEQHSKVGTWLIFSASQRLHLPWHKTIKNKQQWIDVFEAKGFENTDTDFGGDVIRNEGDSVKCYLKKTK